MAFILRNVWPLAGAAALLLVASLAFNLGAPAAIGGLALGMLLMMKAGQRDPAPDVEGWSGGGGTGAGAEPAP